MAKSKQATRQQRDYQDQFERQKIRHIKHDRLSRHLSDDLIEDEQGLLSSAELQRLEGHEGF